MKLAIMQPYLFPYAGYFSLLCSVDRFVFYDDVDFIKSGWINRNRLYLSGDVRYFTIPLSGASSNLKINEVKCQPKRVWERKLLASIEQSYSKAPNFKSTYDLIRDVISIDSDYIADFAKNSIEKISERFEIDTCFVASSSIYENIELSGVGRVLDICLKERAQKYINAPGGRSLYAKEIFQNKGIELLFSTSGLKPYRQFDREFIPGLSIIDMMMFNDFDRCKELIL